MLCVLVRCAVFSVVCLNKGSAAILNLGSRLVLPALLATLVSEVGFGLRMRGGI